MRTTLTLSAAMVRDLRKVAERRRLSFPEAVQETLRAGLFVASNTLQSQLGSPDSDLDQTQLMRVSDDLAIEEIIDKLPRRMPPSQSARRSPTQGRKSRSKRTA